MVNDKESWVPIKWASAKEGQQVWLAGTDNGAFRAYGPHKVRNPKTKQLASGGKYKGSPFTHMAEDLLVPVSFHSTMRPES